MKINMHMVRCELDDIDLSGALTSDPYEKRISFASISTDATHLSNDRLHLLRHDELDRYIGKLDPYAPILCIGTPSPEFLRQDIKIDLLWTQDDVSLFDIANRVNAMISSCSEWTDALSDAFSVTKPLRKVAEISEPIFDRPIWMWDSQLQTVFHVAKSDAYELPEDYKMHLDGKPWPIQEVNAVNDAFRNALSFRNPHILPPMFGYESLCYNLFDGDSYIATLAIDNVTGKEFTIKDKILIKHLGDQMISALKYEAHFSKHATYVVNECLERLLQGETIPGNDLQAALSHMGWNINDSYFCILAHQSTDTSYPDVFLIPTAESISDLVSDSLFFIVDGSILSVVNLTLSDLHPDRICEPILKEIKSRGFKFKLGVSTPFSNFSHVKYFFDQAHEAIHIGERFDRNEEILMFHDHILDEMIEKCLSGTVPETLYLPGLSRLIRYDKAHDSDLVKTLNEYLTNGMSMKRTSEALFMHRNTLLTRLKTIEEISQLDLDDHKTRVQLMMAFLFTDELHYN